MDGSRHAPGPFLGVERSVTGRQWRARLDEAGRLRAAGIVQRHATPDILARILAARGVEAADLPAYLAPTLRETMPDPSTLVGMDAAAARLADAAERGEAVAIFGDYDVDGATASALLATFLQAAGLDPRIRIPDRLIEGYGPNATAIEEIAAQGARLLVTVDCGTTSHQVLEDAMARGLDVVVADHHQADELLPEVTALVNPNRLDDLSGQGHLAAVGVVFLLVVAVNRELRRRGFWTEMRPEPDLRDLLDLVALGTVADVVPLRGLNRAFVLRGLEVMRRRRRVGLTALVDAANLDGPPTPYHLGFLLGPRINAGGRIGDAGLGARLLTTADTIEAAKIAADLNRLNAERQAMELAMLAEAEAEVTAELIGGAEAHAIATSSPSWHPGVLGLIAARLKERHERPAFAIAFDRGQLGTGSGRSIAGVDLGRAVRRAVADGLLVKGGGHAMAAGITIDKAALAAFRSYLDAALGEEIAAARRDRSLKIDAALSAGALVPRLIDQIETAGPFGAGNPQPVLALPAHRIAFADVVGQGHVRAQLQSGDGAGIGAIAFRAAGQPLGEALLSRRGEALHLAGSAVMERWQGTERVRFRISDAALPNG